MLVTQYGSSDPVRRVVLYRFQRKVDRLSLLLLLGTLFFSLKRFSGRPLTKLEKKACLTARFFFSHIARWAALIKLNILKLNK